MKNSESRLAIVQCIPFVQPDNKRVHNAPTGQLADFPSGKWESNGIDRSRFERRKKKDFWSNLQGCPVKEECQEADFTEGNDNKALRISRG